MIYGGIDLAQWLAVTGVKRTVTASRRLDKTEVPGMDGAHVADGGLEPVEIKVECSMLARSVPDVSDARRALSAALRSTEALPLFLDDEPGRYLMAWYEGGAELGRNAHKPGLTLKFLAADPVAYGEKRTASVGTSGALVVAGGTYRACPTVTCKPASGTYWQVTNINTGDFVRVEESFTGSQTVVLDMAKERCTVNGADHAVTLASDFFALDGTQTLKTSSGTATLEWEERWL